MSSRGRPPVVGRATLSRCRRAWLRRLDARQSTCRPARFSKRFYCRRRGTRKNASNASNPASIAIIPETVRLAWATSFCLERRPISCLALDDLGPGSTVRKPRPRMRPLDRTSQGPLRQKGKNKTQEATHFMRRRIFLSSEEDFFLVRFFRESRSLPLSLDGGVSSTL